jgi:hypothetical protein
MRLIAAAAAVVTTDIVSFERIGDFDNSSAPRLGKWLSELADFRQEPVAVRGAPGDRQGVDGASPSR